MPSASGPSLYSSPNENSILLRYSDLTGLGLMPSQIYSPFTASSIIFSPAHFSSQAAPHMEDSGTYTLRTDRNVDRLTGSRLLTVPPLLKASLCLSFPDLIHRKSYFLSRHAVLYDYPSVFFRQINAPFIWKFYGFYNSFVYLSFFIYILSAVTLFLFSYFKSSTVPVFYKSFHIILYTRPSVSFLPALPVHVSDSSHTG